MNEDVKLTLDTERLRAEIGKLSTASVQAKLQLHDVAEELPTGW